MNGKRVYPNKDGHLHVHNFENGDYGKHERGGWYARTPNGLACNLSGHDVTEHVDGTITVSPSILVTGGGDWHGYLEKGIWRSV